MSENKNASYSLNLPYPETAGLGQDIKLANMLLNPYTGIWGELSSISDYIYQSIVFEERDPEISEVLNYIAMSEMHHFKLIGELIFNLGSNPVIKTNIKTDTINTRLLDSKSVIGRVLENNIRAEKYAIKTYSKIISQIRETAVITLLERIILDEEYHIKLFSELLDM